MLFSSPEFLLLFLPATVIAFYFARKLLGAGDRPCVLVFASLVFYGYWRVEFLPVLLFSILFNQAAAHRLARVADTVRIRRRIVLTLAIAANLGLLFYFKYFVFVAENVAPLAGFSITAMDVLLPLGISFYTFQQIAYQVDVYRHKTAPASLLDYALFVSFFPQLIAGPIVHHSEMMPQFASRLFGTRKSRNFAIGLTIFALGLFKKVCIADQLAPSVNLVFDQAATGTAIDFYAAWCAAVGYAMQLYFDFSGYSDMAIGLARMFGIRLPLNFFSPYKAVDMIDFWRRWHMTLSRFLRDYLYIPLGGNRHGELARYRNIFVTMLLGGIWHGAGWTFVVWGAYHGLLIMINHAIGPLRSLLADRHRGLSVVAKLVTFFLVTVGWVPFRADDMTTAISILSSMFGGQGLSLPGPLEARVGGLLDAHSSVLGTGEGLSILAAFLVTQLMPNTFEVMRRYRPAFDFYHMHERVVPALKDVIVWKPTWIWATATAAILLVSVTMSFSGQVEFLYYDF